LCIFSKKPGSATVAPVYLPRALSGFLGGQVF
jgi:hypothetical protein